jgi:2-octaprenyl-6-methoxyphenol hydroxylase
MVVTEPKNAAETGEVIRSDVLIVGGGMVGLTLALALGGAGLEVVVVDRDDPSTLLAAPYDGRASAIAYGSRRVLEGLGAWNGAAGMAGDAEPILDIRVSDGDAPLFLHYDHREVGDEPLGHIIENRAIRRALFARQAEIAAIDLRAPASLTAIDYAAGGVTATLDDGMRIRANLAVAADGRNSRMRDEAGITTTRWRYKQTGIVCTMGHERPHRGVAHERFLPAGPFAVLPMTDDLEHGHRSSIVWTEDERLAPAMMELDDEAFSAELGRRFGPYYGEVRVLGGRWSYPLSLLHANRYAAPRLALVGDAAHAIHPIAGQGLNLGIRGVAALAEVIVETARLGLDIGADDVLKRYERWRRFDAMALVAVTDGLNRLFSNAIPPVRLARDLGLAGVNLVAPAKRFFMRHAMGLVGDLPRLMKGEPL